MGKFKVGDVVKRIEYSSTPRGLEGAVGFIGEITNTESNFISFDDGRTWYDQYYYKLIEENNTAKFKVGDVVKCIRRSHNNKELEGEIGFIGKITDKIIDVEIGCISFDNGYTWFDECHYELVEENDMKLYTLKFDLDLQQVLQLNIITGKLNNMSEIYYKTDDILEENGVGAVDTHDWGFINIHRIKFQSKCKEIVDNNIRPTVEVDGKKYYEDDYLEALSNLKEVI